MRPCSFFDSRGRMDNAAKDKAGAGDIASGDLPDRTVGKNPGLLPRGSASARVGDCVCRGILPPRDRATAEQVAEAEAAQTKREGVSKSETPSLCGKQVISGCQNLGCWSF